jgi:membrane associated rhomboid family serine protease
VATCYRHRDRETGVSCSACGNPICTDCMTPTPVGMRCPDCAGQKTKVHTARSMVVEPRVTYALIAINVVAFFAQALAAGSGRPRAGGVYTEGVLFGPFVDDGEWWRLVTSGFLHADPIHLILNMVVLFFLGQMLEPAFGHVKFAFLYGASLLAGSFGALLVSPEAATIGASGAVYGLMGAIVVHLRDRGIPLMQTFVGPLLIISVLWNFTRSDISVGGHLGGLVGGALAALLILWAQRRRSTALALAGCVAVAVVSVVGAIIAAGTESLYF